MRLQLDGHMKSLLAASIFALIVVPLAARSAADDQQSPAVAEQEIRRLLQAWDAAIGHRNVGPLGKILADDFTITDAGGSVLTKAEYLASIVKTPSFARVASFASEDVQVQIDGDTAAVTGRSQVKGRPRGRLQALLAHYAYTDTWVKANGTWKAVATKATRLSEER